MTDAHARTSRARRCGPHARRLASLLSAAAVLAGCARPGPPPGGPADTTPPDVVRTLPADGDIWVDPSTIIEVEFSEEMDRQSTERAFALTESLALRNLRWRGRVLLAEPVDALKDTATFFVRIAESAKDNHGVRLGSVYSFAFTTGGAIDAGRVSGTVTALGEPIGGATVWACEGDVEADSLGTVEPCGFSATTTDDGGFVVANVRSSEVSYSLVAFVDRNQNGRYDSVSETGWVVPAAARVDAPGDSVGGLTIEMRVPEEGAAASAD